jgi:uncharacterized membrane protein YgaE (UPF0421/DUF939 family)
VGLVVSGAVVERIGHQIWAIGVIVCIVMLLAWVLRSDVMTLEDAQ